jgi:hypothetical protein
MTPETDDLTCIRRITILVPWTPTLPMTATIRLINASTSMGQSRRIRKLRWLLEGGTPRHLTLSSLAHKTKSNSLVQPKEHNLSRFKNCKPSSMRNERTCAYFNRPSSGSAWRAHVAEELKREPAMSIVTSLRIGRANPHSSIELARTSLPPPCFSVICLSHLPRGLLGP